MEWEKTKFGLLSAAGGAVVLAIIGFNWGGWVTTGTAEAMAKEIAANAIAERLGSICVAQANRDPHKGQKLDEATVRQELEGNICRCTGYHNIVKAVLDGASKM